ncbi:MAG: type IV pilus biogenesis protein PilM [Pararobbsia sp.]
MIWVLAALGVLAGAYALIGNESTAPQQQRASSMALATNMSAYRQAVAAFALANPSFTGSVPAASLTPLLGSSVANPMWRNYVQPNTDIAGSLIVIYATTAAAGAAVVGMEQLAQGSAMAGIALGATIVSPGNPAVPLPAALVNVIPNGMPVWMGQIYE